GSASLREPRRDDNQCLDATGGTVINHAKDSLARHRDDGQIDGLSRVADRRKGPQAAERIDPRVDGIDGPLKSLWSSASRTRCPMPAGSREAPMTAAERGWNNGSSEAEPGCGIAGRGVSSPMITFLSMEGPLAS